MEPREYVLDCLSGRKLFPIPGVGFHPTDVQLVGYYLLWKATKKEFPVELIAEVDVYKFAPWELADESIVKGDLKWYFFCPIEKKYLSGVRMNRATDVGHWKITGRDRRVLHNNALVGSIKTLIFHKGKAPGERTDWVMHEYRLDDTYRAERGVAQSEHVLCKIFQKEGPGPRNNAQYGAPFEEEVWIDGLSIPASVLPNNHSNSLAAGTSQLNSSASESCFSEIVPSQLPSVQSNNVDSNELPQVLGDDVFFSTSLVSNEDKKNKKPVHDRTAEVALPVDPNYKRLGYLAGPSEDVYTGSLYNGLNIWDLDKPLNFHPEAGEPQDVPFNGLNAGHNNYIDSEQFPTSKNTIHDGAVDAELPVDPISKHFEDLGNKAGPSEFGSIFHSGSLYNGLNMRDLDKPLNPEAGESQQFPAFFLGGPEVLYVPHQSDPSPDLPCEIENASDDGTAEASFPSDFFEGLENLGNTTSGHGDVPSSSPEYIDIDDLWKQLGCPSETGESQHIQTNDPEQFPVNTCHAAQQLPVSDLSQKDSSNKKERKRKRKEHNDERK